MKYRYSIQTGITKTKTHIRQVVFGTAAALILIGGASGAAFAATTPNNTSNGSYCGSYHAARADVYGNYGSLGSEGGTPGAHNGAVGQDPGATGYNNSHGDCQSY